MTDQANHAAQNTYRVTIESGAIVEAYDIKAKTEWEAGQAAMMAFEGSVSERSALNASVTMVETLPDQQERANEGDLFLRVGDANWNLEIRKGHLMAVAKPGSGASDCFFGDRHHIARLLNEKHDEYTQGWTEAGLAYLAGLQSTIVTRRVCFG